ncbi:Putative multidrug resistance protein MdtD [Streptomyces spiroverticillatus]
MRHSAAADESAPDPVPSLRIASARGRWTLLATVLGSSVVLLGSTVTNVALPRIGLDFGADLAVLQWTVNAYMLTLAGLILLGGSLGDRLGRRRIFVVGVVWFAVASLLCGLVPDAGTLIVARALQGIGGALLTPGSLAIIEASFHPDDRPNVQRAPPALFLAGDDLPQLGAAPGPKIQFAQNDVEFRLVDDLLAKRGQVVPQALDGAAV